MRYLTPREVKLIGRLRPAYANAVKIVEPSGSLPWQLLAPVHARECDFGILGNEANAGPFSFDPAGKGPDVIRDAVSSILADYSLNRGYIAHPLEFCFWTAAIIAAHVLKTKLAGGPPLHNPNGTLNIPGVAWAYWGYNGRSHHHVCPGEQPDPPDAFIRRSWRFSPYVSNDPLNGLTFRLTGTVDTDTSRLAVDTVDERPGALVLLADVLEGFPL